MSSKDDGERVTFHITAPFDKRGAVWCSAKALVIQHDLDDLVCTVAGDGDAVRRLTQGDVRKIANAVMDLWHPQGKCESVLDDCGPCIFCWGETELEGDKNEEDQVQMVRCIVDLVIAAVRP